MNTQQQEEEKFDVPDNVPTNNNQDLGDSIDGQRVGNIALAYNSQ